MNDLAGMRKGRKSNPEMQRAIVRLSRIILNDGVSMAHHDNQTQYFLIFRHGMIPERSDSTIFTFKLYIRDVDV